MIQSNMRLLPYQKSTRTKDEYGQYQYTYTAMGDIDISIFLYQQNITYSNPLFEKCTHIGLTDEKSVGKHDRIGNYEVIYTNPAGRLNQVYLREVD